MPSSTTADAGWLSTDGWPALDTCWYASIQATPPKTARGGPMTPHFQSNVLYYGDNLDLGADQVGGPLSAAEVFRSGPALHPPDGLARGRRAPRRRHSLGRTDADRLREIPRSQLDASGFAGRNTVSTLVAVECCRGRGSVVRQRG